MDKQGLKVYKESSVISGYGRERFHDYLMMFFDMVRKGVFIPIISAHTIGELYDEKTPQDVLSNFQTIEYIEYQTK